MMTDNMNGSNCTLDMQNPVYLKLAMRLAYEYLKEDAQNERSSYLIAPDGKKITLPFAMNVVQEFANAI